MFEERELEQYLSEAPTIDQKKAMGRGMFAYTPTSDPATWMLPLGPPGSKEPTSKYCGMAAAAALGDGFRGKKADVPEEAKVGIKRKIRGAYKKCGVAKADWPDYVREGVEDATPLNLLSEAVDLGGRSFDEFVWDLECALGESEVFPGVYMVWVYKVWDGQCLVGPGGSEDSYLVPYTVTDGEFVFGIPVEAEHIDKWVPKVEPDEPVVTLPTLSAEERWSSVGKAEEITESVGSLTERHEIVESAMVVLEAKGKQPDGSLKIEGVCGRFDDNYINKNRRFYERKLADTNVPRLNERARRNELVGLADHPDNGSGSITDRAFKYCGIDESEDAAWVDGQGFLHFTGYILPTVRGSDLIVQAEHGMAIPFSWRGIGSEEIVERNGRKVKKVCEDYELITWDAVNDASCAGTGVTAIKEEVTMPGPGEVTNEAPPQTTVNLTEEQYAAHLEAASKKGAESVLTERDLKEWTDHKDSVVESEVNLLVKATPKLETFRKQLTTFLTKVEKREDLSERVKLAQETYGSMVSSESAEDFKSKGVSVMQDRKELAGTRMLVAEGRCTGRYRDVERPETAEAVIDLLAEGLSDTPLSPEVVRLLHSGKPIPGDLAAGLMGNSEFTFRVAANNYLREFPTYLHSMTQEGAAKRKDLFELTGTTDIAPGAPFVLPLVRDIWPRIVDPGIWGTQVIGAPTGKVFYMHYTTDPGAVRLNTAGSGLFASEESEQPPKIKITVASENIEVEKIGVSYEWKIEAEQDIRAYHNLDLQGELIGVARKQIGREWFWNMIQAIFAAATGGDLEYGTLLPTAGGYSVPEWQAEIFRHLLKQAGAIGAPVDVQYVPNVALVGALDSFRFSTNGIQQGWAASPDAGFNPEYQFGVRSLGTYDGLMRVFQIDQWSQYHNKKILLGYSGSSWMEQGAVMCVYIPLYIGPVIETLSGDRGQAMFSRAKAKVVRPKGYGTVTVNTAAHGLAPA